MGDSLPERNDPNTERNQGKTANIRGDSAGAEALCR